MILKLEKMKNSIYIIVFGLLLGSCDFLEPKLSNDREFEDLFDDPATIRGFLTNGYLTIPSGPNTIGSDFLDVATGNAVTNAVSTGISRMASDGWSAVNNPIDSWASSFSRIATINQFLEIENNNNVVYIRKDSSRNQILKQRMQGEAYFLRAYHQFDILKRYAGKGPSGTLLGYPIVLEHIDLDNVPVLSRSSFSDCVDQIVSDLDSSKLFLPKAYTGTSEELGVDHLGRPTSIAAEALKSRLLLYAASKIYNEDEDIQKWSKAATSAKATIDSMGATLPSVYGTGSTLDAFYNNISASNTELIMRRLGADNSSYEQLNFPPSQFGNGRTNPSQNLVDAFPMANGYPINHPSSGYDVTNPYSGRDLRLDMTVLYNGAIFRENSIQTFEGGADALGSDGVRANNSTRTGYYLRKWLSTTADRNPADIQNARHYFPVIRKVEVFLNYAEAANEAFGPNTAGGLGMTAVEALREVRRRAGIPDADPYLAEVSSDQGRFRELVRNERRIELAFEGHYFFDVRRWKEDLNEPVKGVNIRLEGVNTVYDVDTVYVPNYEEHMYYGPLPFDEVLKAPSIVQNAGW